MGDSGHGNTLDPNLANTHGIKELVPPKEIGYFFGNYLVANKYGTCDDGRILENFTNRCNIMI